MADHDGLLPGDGRERGHPAALLIHAYIGTDLVLLLLRIKEGLQRMLRAEGVPQTIIDIEVMSVGNVHRMVVTAEVSSVFRDIGHGAEGPVERGIKDRSLPFSAARDVNRTEGVVPRLTRLGLGLIEGPAWNLPLEISAVPARR